MVFNYSNSNPKTLTSKAEKVISTCKRKHVMFVSLDLGSFTQDDCFQIHHFPTNFITSFLLTDE